MAKIFFNGERITRNQYETKMFYQLIHIGGMGFDEAASLVERTLQRDEEDLRDIYLPDGIEIMFN